MKIAVSACLLGTPCRYDGKSVPCEETISLMREHTLVPICPEVLGGLPTPRLSSEIVEGRCANSSQKILENTAHESVTETFYKGAQKALDIYREMGCDCAILKSKSPSCGNGIVYDGSFSGTLTEGQGVCAALFSEACIPVFDETTEGMVRFREFLHERGSANLSAQASHTFSSDEIFQRMDVLVGHDIRMTLADKTVVVFGAGGVGSHCILALARAGIGRLVIIDGDVVSPSNINRQAIAFVSTVGQRKVDVALRLVHDINPLCDVQICHQFMKPEDIDGVFDRNIAPDYVIDAIDDTSVKVALAAYCEKHQIPLVSCMGTAGKTDAHMFQFSDIYSTEQCPLCRSMRSKLRKAGVESLEVLYSKEEARPSAEVDGERLLGTVSWVPSVAGLLIAGRVVKRLINQED